MTTASRKFTLPVSTTRTIRTRVGHGTTKRMTTRSAMTFPGPRARTRSRWAVAGRFTRRFRISSATRRGLSPSTTTSPEMTLRISCSALASGYNELAVQDSGKWNNVSWAAYVQDNWRVNHRLTLNLGLRWDGVPHTYEANNRMGNFYPNLYNPAAAPIFADAAGQQHCTQQPRAWAPARIRSWRVPSST